MNTAMKVKPVLPKTEAEVSQQVIAILEKHGVVYRRVYGREDGCDFICCVPTQYGSGWYLEVKVKATVRHKSAPYEKERLPAVRAANGMAMVVHGGNLREFEDLIESAKNGNPTIGRYQDNRKAKLELSYANCDYKFIVYINKYERGWARLEKRIKTITISISWGDGVNTVAHEAHHAAKYAFPDEMQETITYEQICRLLNGDPIYKNKSKEWLLEEARATLAGSITEDIMELFHVMHRPIY